MNWVKMDENSTHHIHFFKDKCIKPLHEAKQVILLIVYFSHMFCLTPNMTAIL